jgi:hypothetical protein
MFFELKNGKVIVSDQGMLNIHVKKLHDSDHSRGKEKFHKMASYAFHVYDKRSMYRNLPEQERRKIVCSDVLEHKNYWTDAEGNESFQALISKMNNLQFTHKERLLEGCKRKIDDYISYFDNLKIGEKNERDYRNVIKGSEDLIDFFDKLELKVNKEALSRQVGGGESKIFEDKG